jgi:molybdopterin/thiamine biosynthesis adenylyltransferase/molybdopterin synthase catalytic subunit/rhodanese-related sulfurtransferase
VFSISKKPLQPSSLSSSLANESAGALATFEGWVRNHNDGRSVVSLEYECYEALAQKEGDKIIAEAKAQFEILDATCIHRIGNLKVGELAVWVGVTARHRAAAFDACRFVIDEIKLRVPIWKKEQYESGTTNWVNCADHKHQTESPTGAKIEMSSSQLSESKFYSRQTSLKEVGSKGQEKFKNSRVLVIGAGGTGCPALQYLAGAGIGKITICDFDSVDITNLHRQPLYTTHDLGKNKAEVAAARLAAANPFIKIVAVSEKFDSDSASRLVEDSDVILDCTDNLSAKFCIAESCREFSKTLVQSSVHGFDGQLLLWRPLDLNKHEQHGKQLSQPGKRDGFTKLHEGQCYRCLWPSQELLQVDGKDCVESCAESGVLGAVPGLLGTMQAIEALKVLLGLPTALTENVLLIDLIASTTTKIKVRTLGNCPLCGTDQAGGESRTGKKTGAKPESQAELQAGSRAELESDDKEQASEFELHWSVLKTRSPRELVYVDIRSDNERESDETTKNTLKGRVVQKWPLETMDVEKLELDRNLTYLFLCQRGKRSATLVQQLRSIGHRNVFSLSQGAESLAHKTSEHAKV